MKKIYLLSLIVVSMLWFVGCEGDEGPAGPAGSVNITTGSFTVNESDIVELTDEIAYAEHEESAINLLVLSEGAVIVYKRFNNEWYSVPFDLIGDGSIRQSILENRVFVELVIYNGNVMQFSNLLTGQYRYVVIPPDRANLNTTDYNAVMREFGLISSDFQQ